LEHLKASFADKATDSRGHVKTRGTDNLSSGCGRRGAHRSAEIDDPAAKDRSPHNEAAETVAVQQQALQEALNAELNAANTLRRQQLR
jgi:hypothetical protein